MREDYKLDILDLNLRPFILYDNLIGIFENEPYQLRFSNKTGQTIQIKICIDNQYMPGVWLINGYEVVDFSRHPIENTEFLFKKDGLIKIEIYKELNCWGQLNLPFEGRKLVNGEVLSVVAFNEPKLINTIEIEYKYWPEVRKMLRENTPNRDFKRI